jgi:hypothetical protein
MTNEEFCQRYRLGNDILIMLGKIHFAPGDNLERVTEKELCDAGFQSLSWMKVRKANHQWKREFGEMD